MKALRTVTDRFSIVDCIRKHTPQNKRNYILKSIKASISDPVTLEHMKLGELFGYYGHNRREEHYNRTGSLKLPETSIIMVDGKPVVLDNVPSNRTLSINMDESGIITHTQEILQTDPGRIVDGMDKSNAGGWSWITSGSDSWISVVREFFGFDYVTTPNYISLDKKSMMAESASDRQTHVVRTLIESGYTESAAIDISEHFEKMRGQDMMIEGFQRAQNAEGELLILTGKILEMTESLHQQSAMLEKAESTARLREKHLSSIMNNLPIFLSEEQKQAMLRMETEQDLQSVQAIFESVSKTNFSTLPLSTPNSNSYEKSPKKGNKLSDMPVLRLSPQRPQPFK